MGYITPQVQTTFDLNAASAATLSLKFTLRVSPRSPLMLRSACTGGEKTPARDHDRWLHCPNSRRTSAPRVGRLVPRPARRFGVPAPRSAGAAYPTPDFCGSAFYVQNARRPERLAAPRHWGVAARQRRRPSVKRWAALTSQNASAGTSQAGAIAVYFAPDRGLLNRGVDRGGRRSGRRGCRQARSVQEGFSAAAARVARPAGRCRAAHPGVRSRLRRPRGDGDARRPRRRESVCAERRRGTGQRGGDQPATGSRTAQGSAGPSCPPGPAARPAPCGATGGPVRPGDQYAGHSDGRVCAAGELDGRL